MVRFSAKERDGAAEAESSSRGRKRTRTVSEVEVVAEESEDEADVSDDGNDEDENGEAVEEQAVTTDGSISVILTDPDILDCIVCYYPLKIPVFQCENGHIACSSCCTKLKNKCPSCSFPIGYNRCRAIEKVIESVKALCRNSRYGCVERLSLSERKDHEYKCVHKPYTCPISRCGFEGSCQKLWQHCSDTHSELVKRFQYNRLLPFSLDKNCEEIILIEEKEDAVFVLKNSRVGYGMSLSRPETPPTFLDGNLIIVRFVCPIVPRRVLSYDLMARKDSNTLRLHSKMEENCYREYGTKNSNFLVVPHVYSDDYGLLKMELCIQYSNLA